MTDELHKRAHALEKAFFNKLDEELLAKLRAQGDAQRRQGELSGATGIQNSEALRALAAHGVTPDSVLALALAPIVAMVWRKGRVDPHERNAVLRVAEERGVTQGTPGFALLENWLERRPSADLRQAWEAYVAALRQKLSAAEFAKLREDIVGRAREVARSAGGFLGVGAVSAEEKRMIAELEKAMQ